MALFAVTTQRGGVLMNFMGLYSKLESNGAYNIVGGVRWRRRPRNPPPWYVKQRTAFIEQNLTPANKGFLQEITEDIYDEKYKAVVELAPEASPLRDEHGAVERRQWTPESIRTGFITKKIGVLPQWTKEGKRMTATILQVQDNYVARYTDPETWYKTSTVGKKYGRRVLGRLSLAVNPSDPQYFTAQYRGMFENSGVMPPEKLATFAITPDARLEPGTRLYATHFTVGQWVTLTGLTVDRGFQGVMKRWGFKGGPSDARGCTKWHRRPGSIGTSGDATVWRGRCLPGHMGREWRQLAGVKLIRIDTKHQLLYVCGQTMGKVGTYVYVKDCGIWTKRVKNPPFPTHYPDEEKEPFPDDLYDPSLFNFSEPTITFPEEDEKKVKRTVTGSKVKKQAKVKK